MRAFRQEFEIFVLSAINALAITLLFKLFFSFGKMTPWITIDLVLEGVFTTALFAFQRSRKVLVIQALLGILFRAINITKIQYLNTALLPTDFYLVRELIEILPVYKSVFIAAMTILPVLAAGILFFRGVQRPKDGRWLTTVPAASIVIWLFVFPSSYATAFDGMIKQEIFGVPFLLKERGEAIGVPLSFSIDLAKFLKIEFQRPSRREVITAVSRLPKADPPSTSILQTPRKPNIYIILAESFWDPTPFLHLQAPLLDAGFQQIWKENGGRHFLSPMFGGGTANVEFEVLCGIPARSLGRGIVFQVSLANSLRCLPEILSEAGYRTMAFHPFDPGYYNRDVAFPRIGFQKFFSIRDYKPDAVPGDFIADRAFISNSIFRARAAAEGQPFLAYMMTFAEHWPYAWLPIYDQEHDKKIELDGKKEHPDLEVVERYLNVNLLTSRILRETVTEIRHSDPTAIVVIAGDHLPNLANDLLLQVSSDDITDWHFYRTPLIFLDPQNPNPVVNGDEMPAYRIGEELLQRLGFPKADRAHFDLFAPPAGYIVRGVQNGATFVSSTAGSANQFHLCTPQSREPMCSGTMDWLRTIHILALDLVAGSQYANDPSVLSMASTPAH